MGVMGQGLHGIHVDTPDSLLLDAGIAYANIDETKLALDSDSAVDQAIASAVLLGATRENASFSSGREVRPIEINGVRYPLKGLKRVDAYEPILTLVLLEHTQANLEHMLSTFKVTVHPKFREYEPDVEIDDADYLTNVALLTKLSGKETPVLIVMRNALVVNAFELELEDKNEAATSTEWLAHATPAAPHDPPFAVYYPGAAAS